jgi:hypothetical protein
MIVFFKERTLLRVLHYTFQEQRYSQTECMRVACLGTPGSKRKHRGTGSSRFDLEKEDSHDSGITR